jgi:hypothetical protein
MTPAKRRRAWVVIDGGKRDEIFNPFLWWFWWLR